MLPVYEIITYMQNYYRLYLVKTLINLNISLYTKKALYYLSVYLFLFFFVILPVHGDHFNSLASFPARLYISEVFSICSSHRGILLPQVREGSGIFYFFRESFEEFSSISRNDSLTFLFSIVKHFSIQSSLLSFPLRAGTLSYTRLFSALDRAFLSISITIGSILSASSSILTVPFRSKSKNICTNTSFTSHKERALPSTQRTSFLKSNAISLDTAVFFFSRLIPRASAIVSSYIVTIQSSSIAQDATLHPSIFSR